MGYFSRTKLGMRSWLSERHFRDGCVNDCEHVERERPSGGKKHHHGSKLLGLDHPSLGGRNSTCLKGGESRG